MHVSAPDVHDATHDDHERFERRQLAPDRDARASAVVAIDESAAREIVQDLREAGLVTVSPAAETLVHLPSGSRFQSDRALAFFHRGWTARTDTESAAEDSS
jgi:hypothetical protein